LGSEVGSRLVPLGRIDFPANTDIKRRRRMKRRKKRVVNKLGRPKRPIVFTEMCGIVRA
jgi:hypothetical protein